MRAMRSFYRLLDRLSPQPGDSPRANRQDHPKGVGSPAQPSSPISPALRAINPLRNAPYVPPSLSAR